MNKKLLAVAVAGALAAPFEVPIDQAQSSVAVELCLLGKCDSDTSAVAGSTTWAR